MSRGQEKGILTCFIRDRRLQMRSLRIPWQCDGVSDYTADRGAELWVSLQLRPGAWAESITSKDITQDMIDIHKQIACIYYYEDGSAASLFPEREPLRSWRGATYKREIPEGVSSSEEVAKRTTWDWETALNSDLLRCRRVC